MLSSIKILAWAFVAGVLMTVAMIAVWKAGAVEGGFVLTMVSAVLTLILAVTAIFALVGEARNGRDADGARELDTRPPVQLPGAARSEPPGHVGASRSAAASKFHVETQGGPAYVAENISFASGVRGRAGSREVSENGASHVD